MAIRDRLLAGLARQLSRPEGLPGRLVGRRLNKSNRSTLAAAVEATGLGAGQVAGDIGFGGGAGLQILLDRVGPTGHVHGVELSDTMLAAARRRYQTACAEGRATLRAGTLNDLPLDDGSLDGLITVNTIYFVADLEGAFREIARVLRPSGRAVIGLADPKAMASMPFTAYGFRIRPVDEVVEVLNRAGLPAIRHERFGNGDEAYHLLIASCARTSD